MAIHQRDQSESVQNSQVILSPTEQKCFPFRERENVSQLLMNIVAYFFSNNLCYFHLKLITKCCIVIDKSFILMMSYRHMALCVNTFQKISFHSVLKWECDRAAFISSKSIFVGTRPTHSVGMPIERGKKKKATVIITVSYI